MSGYLIAILATLWVTVGYCSWIAALRAIAKRDRPEEVRLLYVLGLLVGCILFAPLFLYVMWPRRRSA